MSIPPRKQREVTCGYSAAQLNGKHVTFTRPQTGTFPFEGTFEAVRFGDRLTITINFVVDEREGRTLHYVSQPEADRIKARDASLSAFTMSHL
jgi:hypothetical protein